MHEVFSDKTVKYVQPGIVFGKWILNHSMIWLRMWLIDYVLLIALKTLADGKRHILVGASFSASG